MGGADINDCKDACKDLILKVMIDGDGNDDHGIFSSHLESSKQKPKSYWQKIWTRKEEIYSEIK